MASASPPAVYIDAPRHPDLKALFEYWSQKRGSRLMPLRADIKPAELKTYLADIMIWNAAPPYHIRLIGDHIVSFVGANNTGKSATDGMSPPAAASMIEVLSQVVAAKAPRFRTGKAHWVPDKSYRDFEACFLPLTEDGESVDTILSGIKFDMTR